MRRGYARARSWCYTARMLFTRSLIPTLKEAPGDAASASHVFLMRAGYIRRVGAGMYDFLPLGLRVLRKVERIVREEMDVAGALEIQMPVLLPAEYYKESGRWDLYGDVLFRLKDRKGADMHLAPTHEEIVTDIARHEIRSYRDLPKNLYQIQTKCRDEPRPRGGLLRCREFSMKDAYSFDADDAGALKSYSVMRDAYARAFARMGLVVRLVSADSGAMGGSTSAEFQALTDSGEDALVACNNCDYAANLEVARVRAPTATGESKKIEKVSTPGKKSIEDVSAFLKIKPEQMLKSLLYVAGNDVIMAVLRGDHTVNEIRLARAAGVPEVFLATDADVRKATGADVGFAGPLGFKGRIVVDRAAALVRGGVAGANETDVHVVGVEHGRDFSGEVTDIRLAQNGDPCPNCDAGTLTQYRGIEAGHIFVLGTHYSAKMGARYVGEDQKEHPLVMGCYGIGISRLVATTVEQHHDQDGIRWPMSLAPYHVHITTIGREDNVQNAAKSLYDALWAAGVETLWDDRDERPGVKFKDADLIGIPLRVTIGAKNLGGGNIELKKRGDKQNELTLVSDAAKTIRERVSQALALANVQAK